MNKASGLARKLAALYPALMVAALGSAASVSMAADSFTGAFEEGKFGIDFRWRLENVDQDPFDKNATAEPLRTRLNYGTGDWNGLSLFVEYDYIADLGLDNYNEGGGNTPDRGEYPIIADVSGGDLNQAFVQYKSGHGSRFRLGRQRITYDNHRFVGNVGWRQNEQTFDAFSFEHKVDNGLEARYSYIANANRIFGDDVPPGDHEMDTHLVNVAYTFGGLGKLTGYYYDIDNEDAAALSNRTWGARFGGSAGDELKIGYTLEYASQEDTADNPVPYDADYWRVDVSAGFSFATLYVGFESLGGDDSRPGQAFRTPLATLHAFNGWADKFLTTPDAGLDDAFIGAKGKLGNWAWNILYHDFSAQSGSGDYGGEIDATLSRKFAKKYGLLLKAASFDSDSPAFGDTTKLWVQLTAGF